VFENCVQEKLSGALREDNTRGQTELCAGRARRQDANPGDQPAALPVQVRSGAGQSGRAPPRATSCHCTPQVIVLDTHETKSASGATQRVGFVREIGTFQRLMKDGGKFAALVTDFEGEEKEQV
jgi:hypothetical protein